MTTNDPHPIELAGLGLAALVLELRPLLVALIALVLTLAGWRPGRQVRPLPVSAFACPATTSVVKLRQQVRALRGSSHRCGGRRIAQARKVDLIAALYGLEVAA